MRRFYLAPPGLERPVGCTTRCFRCFLTRMNFENIDDGIDSYHGTLDGEQWSEVLLTASPTALTGRVTVTDDEIQIVTAENEDGSVNARSPVHILYSRKDIQDNRFVIDRGTATVPAVTATGTPQGGTIT